jgi:TfoX/Sxy family transcriptional regulator of competence genes
MAYDEELASRVEDALAGREGLTSREMFGGIAFMLAGNMACGVIGEEVIVRVPKEESERLIAEHEGLRSFDFTGKPMRGFVCVDQGVVTDPEELAGWVEAGADVAASLPPK